MRQNYKVLDISQITLLGISLVLASKVMNECLKGNFTLNLNDIASGILIQLYQTNMGKFTMIRQILSHLNSLVENLRNSSALSTFKN